MGARGWGAGEAPVIRRSSTDGTGVGSVNTEEAVMSMQYQGKNVRSLRDAREGDQGFVKDGDQVVITMDDGTEKTVKRREVTGAERTSER
jgi:hypothetical protein